MVRFSLKKGWNLPGPDLPGESSHIQTPTQFGGSGIVPHSEIKLCSIYLDTCKSYGTPLEPETDVLRQTTRLCSWSLVLKHCTILGVHPRKIKKTTVAKYFILASFVNIGIRTTFNAPVSVHRDFAVIFFTHKAIGIICTMTEDPLSYLVFKLL